jgi:hypothetical protein
MFGLFNSVVSLATDATKVVLAPVEITVDLVSAVSKPIAEIVKDLTVDIKSMKD